MEPFAWRPARTVAEVAEATHTAAAAMLTLQPRPSEGEAVVVKAGGVDLLDLMKEGLLLPRTLLDISLLEELKGISALEDGTLRIGALTTLGEIAASPLIRRRYAALAEAAGSAASPQIRNRATLGGNLLQRPRCWYLRSSAHHCLRKGGGHCFAFSGDHRYHAVLANHGCAIVHPSSLATPLLAFRAELEILSSGGRSHRLPLEDFFVLPEADLHRENILKSGELLAAVHLPPQASSRHSSYLEVSERAAFDWPLAAAAVNLQMDTEGRCQYARVALGAVAPIPWRAVQTEVLLEGEILDAGRVASAAKAGLQGATPLPHNTYKLPLAVALIRRAVLAAAQLADEEGGAH